MMALPMMLSVTMTLSQAPGISPRSVGGAVNTSMATMRSALPRNRSKGSGLVVPPSMRMRPSMATGRNSPGIAIEAASAGRSAPVVSGTSWRRCRSVVVTASGIFNSEKSAGIASGKNCAQNFSASIWVAWPNAPANKSANVPARDTMRRRIISLGSWAKRMTWRRISLPPMPAAYAAPTSAPIEVPAIAAGFTPRSSSASITAMCASPRAPPPPSARAKVFIRVAVLGSGLEREFPPLGGQWSDKIGLGRRKRAGRGSVANAAHYALQDRREAKEIVGGIDRQIRSRVEAGTLHVGVDVLHERWNAECGKVESDQRAGAGFRLRHMPLHQVI